MAGNEVGSAMWGGMRWPERATVQESGEAPTRALPPGVLAAVASLILVILGAVAVSAGAFVLWGPGAGLIAIGAISLTVGLLLGMTS